MTETQKLASRASWHEMNPLEGRERVAFAIPQYAVLGIVTSLLETDEPDRRERFHWEARPVGRPTVQGFCISQKDAREAIEYALRT